MVIHRAIKCKAYPNQTQYAVIKSNLDSCRFIYNHMLSRNMKMYKRRREHLSYNQMQNLLPSMKDYYPWLKDADSQALKYACRQLDTAYQKFFKHEDRFPRFHSKRGRQCYTTTKGKSIHINGNKVKIPLAGWIRAMGLKELPEDAIINRASVSMEGDGIVYISIAYQYEANIPIVEYQESKVLGLDYKSNGLYVSSDGETADMPHWFRESQAKLTKAQRRLSRKHGSQKGEKKSSGWIKQYKKVAKLYKKIANQRLDYLHKKSKDLADAWDAIGVEDINMRNLSNKDFGNGKATMDNGFGMFRTMLDYKLQERGKQPLIKVDKFYPSSQLCSCCGYQNKEVKDLSIREWTCPKCKTKHNRDQNASENIKQEAIRILKKQDVA